MKLKARALFGLIPIAVVGLLPFSILDNAILKIQYELRGVRKAENMPIVVRFQSIDELKSVLEQGVLLQSDPNLKNCIIIDANPPNSSTCLALKIEDLISIEAIEKTYKKVHSYLHPNETRENFFHRTLYYGGISAYGEINSLELLESLPSTKEKISSRGTTPTYVFIAHKPAFDPPIATPIGSLSPSEVALNVITNSINHSSLHHFPRYIQLVLSLLGGLLVAWFVYTYPTVLAAIFIVTFIFLYFFVSMFFFDKLFSQLPVAAPLVAMIAAYLLSISEKLDTRERHDWAEKNEKDSLRQLEEMRNNFLSLVSHDLKTPIAKIQSLVERLLRGDFGKMLETQTDALQKIISTSGHLQRTISTLLLLGRIESENVVLKKEPTDLVAMLHECVLHYLSIAHERKISLVEELEPLFLAEIDPALMKEVVFNIIDNAIKYSPSGTQITIRCGEMENCPELSPPQAGIWFEVQDHGPGIAIQDRPHIFKKFMRGKQENTAVDMAVKGTGLGLFLAHFFVEKHGGHMGLMSRTAGEPLSQHDPAHQYFGMDGKMTGTVLRVSLPIDTTS